MTDRDFSYYRRRAEDERRAADKAEAPNISRIHRELAERYSAMIESGEAPNADFHLLHINR